MKKRVEIVQLGKVIRALLTSTFVPKGLSAPVLGLYTCIKALKCIPGTRCQVSVYRTTGFICCPFPVFCCTLYNICIA